MPDKMFKLNPEDVKEGNIRVQNIMGKAKAKGTMKNTGMNFCTVR
jgi:hypothetical protein